MRLKQIIFFVSLLTSIESFAQQSWSSWVADVRKEALSEGVRPAGAGGRYRDRGLDLGGNFGIRTGAGGGGVGVVIGEFHGALADDTVLEAPGAFDFELCAVTKGRGGAFETGFESGEQFVVAVIERNFGREAMALRDQLEALVGRDRVGVGAQGEEVAGGFDRCEAGARHQDGSGGGESGFWRRRL